MLMLLLATMLADVEPAAPIKVVASAPYRWAKLVGKKELVIRTAEELVQASDHKFMRATDFVRRKLATDDVCADLKVKAIDWDKQMLLVVSAGKKGSGGYSVKITSTKVEDGVLKVNYTVTSPKGAATDVITYPSVVALVPRHAGKVQFVGKDE